MSARRHAMIKVANMADEFADAQDKTAWMLRAFLGA